MSKLSKKDISSLALGVFDGIHKGHLELFKNLDEKGALLVIDNGRVTLTPKGKREELLSFPCFYYNLIDIKDLSGKEFIEFLKKDFPNLKRIVVGYDFRFGKDRLCGVNELKELFGGETIIVEELFLDNISVHSSFIRDLIRKGDVRRANIYLEHIYSVVGKKVNGQGIGKKSLYPTINIEVKDYLIPKDGIYASKILVDGKLYNSATFIGERLSTDGVFALETYILDVKEIELNNIERIEVFFIEFIRDNEKFDDLEKLKDQISKDIAKAKDILKYS